MRPCSWGAPPPDDLNLRLNDKSVRHSKAIQHLHSGMEKAGEFICGRVLHPLLAAPASVLNRLAATVGQGGEAT